MAIVLSSLGYKCLSSRHFESADSWLCEILMSCISQTFTCAYLGFGTFQTGWRSSRLKFPIALFSNLTLGLTVLSQPKHVCARIWSCVWLKLTLYMWQFHEQTNATQMTEELNSSQQRPYCIYCISYFAMWTHKPLTYNNNNNNTCQSNACGNTLKDLIDCGWFCFYLPVDFKSYPSNYPSCPPPSR